MLIDIFPIWLLFLVTTAIIVAAVEMGFRLGHRVRRKTDAERESPVSTIAGAILGLQAFMLAFTFGLVFDRYDSKRNLVREEANVIRAIWQRSDFLREPDRGTTKALLREYVDDRLAVSLSLDPAKAYAGISRSIETQHQIWEMAVRNIRTDPFMFSDIGSLYVDSVNQMADLNSLRINLGLRARVPSAMWLTLYMLLIAGMVGVGYQTAIGDSRRPRVTSVLAVSFALVVALIAALDHPMNSFISVSQDPMVSLQTEMSPKPQ